jgi:hypothetical protein
MKAKFALSVLIVIFLLVGAGMWLLSPARGYTRIDLENGKLIQDEVTFADPRGQPAPEATAREVEDLYHTGGPFTAKGLNRPFSRIVYRVSEVGTPKMELGSRIVDFKQVVGFGGAVVLTTSHPRRFELLSY